MASSSMGGPGDFGRTSDSKKHSKKYLDSKKRSSIYGEDLSDNDDGLDEDGNPVTVQAAQKLFHSNNNGVFCRQPVYQNKKQASVDLLKGNMRIQQLIKKNKFSHLNHFGNGLRDAVHIDSLVADMPSVRVSKQRNSTNFLSGL